MDAEIAAKRIQGKRPCDGSFSPYGSFSAAVMQASPKVIVELATGAGGGTAALALRKPEDCLLFTLDIGFDCLGNAVGIGDYLGCEDSLLPVCANFWSLPFADSSMDAVCTFCGLDESRENPKTIGETARVLKSGGTFVCVSRENAYMRQGAILEPFGFTKEETIEWLRRCRMYSDVDTLQELCRQHGLTCTAQESAALSNGTPVVITTFVKGH